MKTAHCVNLGCSENALDGALITRYLETNDWKLTDRPEEADLIIVNSCAVTEALEQESLAVYKRMEQIEHANAQVVFAGCLPAIHNQAVRTAGYDGALVTPRSLHRLDTLTDARVPIDEVRSGCVPVSADRVGMSFRNPWQGKLQRTLRTIYDVLDRLPVIPVPRWLWQYRYYPDEHTEFVRISVGCMNQCSFCSIPRAKGRTKSVPLEIVVERVQDAIRRGKRSVALSCDELASYGQDLGTNIAALLDALSALPEQFGLTLRNVHPEWLIRYWQDLKPIFARGKIRYMVVPVQSGCDRILALMKRNHTAAEYQALVREIREISPETVLRTHILLGFPGETEDDFAETCRFVKDLPVDSVFATVYSERSFTPSAELPGKVPAHIARARALKIRALTRANILKGWRWHPFHFGVRAR